MYVAQDILYDILSIERLGEVLGVSMAFVSYMRHKSYY